MFAKFFTLTVLYSHELVFLLTFIFQKMNIWTSDGKNDKTNRGVTVVIPFNRSFEIRCVFISLFIGYAGVAVYSDGNEYFPRIWSIFGK